MGPYQSNFGNLNINSLLSSNTNTTTNTTNMDAATKWGIGLGVTGMIGSTVMGMMASHKASNMTGAIEDMQTNITKLENERPEIKNIYANIQDTSGFLKNEYANLGVATKAAENEQEQVDITLANTLDMLRATGAGAGAATSMALAAMKGKQSISESLESQEAQNQKLRAQGEMQLNQARMAEAQRLQQAEVAGAQWMFTQQDARKMQELNRAQAMLDQERQQQQMYMNQSMAAYGQALGGLGTLGGSLIGGSE